MTPCDEFEAPGVSDDPAKSAKDVLKKDPKPSVAALAGKVPPPSANYEPLHHQNRLLGSRTLHLGLTKPHQYYELFIPRGQFEDIATWTNSNADLKREEQLAKQKKDQSIAGKTPSDVLKGRSWHPTHTAEICVFIGVMLLAGINRCSDMKEFWSPHTDMGRSPDIIEVLLLCANICCDIH